MPDPLTTSPITADQVVEHRARTVAKIIDARRACALAATSATTPMDGRALVAHAAQLSHLLLDDWQLYIVEDLVTHHTTHGPDCTSELCVMDADELVEMADHWALPWPTLAAWLRTLVEAEER